MGKSRELGMKTFDWSLFEPLQRRHNFPYDEAIRNSDSANELRLNIKLNGTRKEPEATREEPTLEAEPEDEADPEAEEAA